MSRARYVQLTDEQDKGLREIESNPLLREKVRLRARVIRLSHRKMSAAEIAEYSGRGYRSIIRDLERWEERGFEGLGDGSAPGNKSPLGAAQQQWLREKLMEDLKHTASDLAEQLRKRFNIRANRESVRVCLREMGYSWQRNRYVPVKEGDPELLHEHKTSLETLKRGRRRVGSS